MSAQPQPSPLAAQASATSLSWPEAYAPATADVAVRSQLTSPAPPAAVWAWLVRAERWPEWYSNAHSIHFISHAGPDLRDRSRIRWNTFGLRITCKVLEFDPERRLAWNAHGIGLDAYVIWLLTPTPDGGTEIVMEATQRGWIARLSNRFRSGHLERMHQLWLESLSRQALAGLPIT